MNIEQKHEKALGTMMKKVEESRKINEKK